MRSKNIPIILSILVLTASALITIEIKEVEGKDGAFGGGSGTISDPYIIEDVLDLQAMNDDLSAHYILKNDINATETKTWNSGDGFVPVGNNSYMFTGSLDGKGYEITGLYINRSGTDHQGLFGYVGTSGVVKNVILIDNINYGDSDVGGLIGSNWGVVLNCSISGNVRGSSKVGGLVGNNSYGMVSKCYVTGNVSCMKNYIGGLVGLNWEGIVYDSYAIGSVSGSYCAGGLVGNNYFGTVSNCYAIGNVYGFENIGGLVGLNELRTLSNCYATGSVNGNNFVGGLVGSNNYGNVSSCSATGSVNGNNFVGGLVGVNWDGAVTNCSDAGNTIGTDYVGGLVGYNNYGNVSNCSATGSVSGWSTVGGLVGYNKDGTVSKCYASGSVGAVSYVGGLVGYNRGAVSNCYAIGGVSGGSEVGGFVGLNEYGAVSNCYSLGNVGGFFFVGGFVGYNLEGKVSNCFATGNVTRSSGTQIAFGGFVGYNRGKIFDCYSIGRVIYEGTTNPTNKGFAGGATTGNKYEMKGNFWDNQTSGQISTSGNATGKNTTDMMRKSTFADAGWDIEFMRFHSVEVWYIDDKLANAGPDQTADMGNIITFNGRSCGCFGRNYPRLGWTMSKPPPIENYSWTFNDGGPISLFGVSPTYRFNNAGMFFVTLKVKDGSGNWDTDTMTVKVNDSVPPVAKLSLKDNFHYQEGRKKSIVRVHENITLSAEGSFDPVGEIVEYHWEIPSQITLISGSLSGDKEASEKIIFQFDENSDTYHNITLWVLDSSGLASSKDWILILPDSAPPTLDTYTLYDTRAKVFLEVPYTIDEDVEIRFNASRASDNGEVIDHIWSFNDGTGTFNGMIVDHYFFDPGNYNISLLLVDAVGNRMKFENRTILVRDTTKPIPVMVLSNLETDMGSEVVLDGSLSYDPRTYGDLYNAISNYTWYLYRVGQNHTTQLVLGNGKVLDHTFMVPGYWVLNLSIIDENGLIAWTEKIIVVNGPDLQVMAIIFVKPEMNKLREGDRAKISVQIKNEGPIDTPEGTTWAVKITLNEKTIQNYTIDTVVKAGEVFYFNFTYEFKGYGNKELNVYLDPTNVVPEIVDNNNEYKISFTVKEYNDGGYGYFCIIQLFFAVVLIAVSIALFLYLRKRIYHGTYSGNLQGRMDQAFNEDEE